MIKKMLLLEAMPRLHKYLLERNDLELRIAGLSSSADIDNVEIIFENSEGPLVSYDVLENKIAFNLAKVEGELNLKLIEARYGDSLVNECVNTLRTAAAFDWSDKPKREHILAGAKFARQYGIPASTFKQRPEVVWVRPMQSRTMMKPVEWIYSKRMPSQDNVHIVRDDKDDAIEQARTDNVAKHNPMAPVIVVQAPSGAWMIADGNHRVHIASQSKQPFRACIYHTDNEWSSNE